MSDLTTFLASLREKAEKATLGPWVVDPDTRPGMEWNNHIVTEAGFRVCFMAHSGAADNEATAAHIAAFNPETALALLDVVEAARHAKYDIGPHGMPAWAADLVDALARLSSLASKP